jgi:hypothetical protein
VRITVTGRGTSPQGTIRRWPGRRAGRSGPAGTLLTGIVAAAISLAGCAGHGGAAAVPSLGSGAAAGSGAPAAGTSTASLHAAAECVRQHGIPGFADPVRTPSGAAYIDLRSLQDAPASVVNAVRASCRSLLVRAGLTSENEPPAPPALVQAGVRAAECERAHGLPALRDPTAQSPYTPGHGFGMTGGEVPGGKLGHGFQEAIRACGTQISAEIRASTLSSLGGNG